MSRTQPIKPAMGPSMGKLANFPGKSDQDPSYGFQSVVRFVPPVPGGPQNRTETQALDLEDTRGVGLWRVSAINSTGINQIVNCRLIYGTSGSKTITGIRTPLVAFVPGNCQLYLLPEANPIVSPVDVLVTAKPAGGYTSPQVVRSFHDATAGAVVLPASGVRFTALAASTVTVEGIAVALAANEDIRLTAPASLGVGGQGIVEHEL